MSDERISKAQLLDRIHQGWGELQAYIATLSDTQMTQPTDDAGWTVKDHLMHLSVWEDGMAALLQGQPRWETMGLPPESAGSRDFDALNAKIQQAHRDKSVAEVKGALNNAHLRMLDALTPLNDADLYKNYNEYLTDPTRDDAVIHWVIGDTYDHYAQHMPWMDAIVKGSKS
jgi:hypothetical protein